MHTLRLTKGTAGPDAHGLIPLRLALVEAYVEDLLNKVREVDHLTVCSGTGSRQTFRRADDPASQPGSLEPIPEGRYDVGDLDWAGAAHDYGAWHSSALGPCWTPINPAAGQVAYRSAIGFHLDANRGAGAPGSAGCVVFPTLDGLKAFVAWMELHRPRSLVVDWGLGSVEKATSGAPPPRAAQRLKVFAHDGRLRTFRNGREVAASAKVFVHDGKLGVVVDGENVAPDGLSIDLTYRT